MMANFWNRAELANPPPHIEKKRKEAVYEWIPCAGSKRKLELSDEERLYENSEKPSAKLFAVDNTVQEYVLDEEGYFRNTSTPNDNSTGTEDKSKPESASEEPESMSVDDCEDVGQTGLRECMVVNEIDKNGGGNCIIGKGSVEYTSLILSHEVRQSMEKQHVDISTVLARQMVKQATMAVVLWKPLPPVPNPMHGMLPYPNSQDPLSSNSDTECFPNPPTNVIGKELKIKNGNDEEMETTETI